MNKLPPGWIWIRLQDIAEKINPGFPSGKHNKNNRGVPHLRPMNINIKGEIDFSEVKHVEPESYDSLLKDDILFNNTNSPALVGKTTYIRKDTNWAYSNHMTRIRFNTRLINSGWIAHMLHTLFLNGFFRMSCVHHVNQASINSTFLSERVVIPFPPLNEQNRIVSKVEELFTKLDAGTEYLKKMQVLLKQYRRSVLKRAFEGKLTEKWREKNKERTKSLLESLQEEFKDKIIEEKKISNINRKFLNMIPKEWVCLELNNISIKIVDGTHFTPNYTSNGIPFISVKDIKNRMISFDNCKYISSDEHNKLKKRCNPEFGDVLITKSGTIGRIAVIKTHEEFSLFVSVALIKPDKQYLKSEFLSYLLENYINNIDIKQDIKGGVLKNFHIEDIKRIPIYLLPIEEQELMITEIETKFSILENNKNLIQKTLLHCEKLRHSILKSAFDGKLVPQDPSDESAEILLQEIKKRKIGPINNIKIKNANYKQMKLM